jgi:signal peptide peptidase SppA
MGKMRQFRRALRSCVGRPLAYQIMDGYGASMVHMLEQTARGLRVPDADIQDMVSEVTYSGPMLVDENGVHFAHDDDADDDHGRRVRAYAGPTIIPGGPDGKATAYVSVKGIAMYDLEWQPYAFSTLLLAQTMNALAADPQIGQIVLDIASPGGMVTGTPEAGDAVFAARKKGKKVLALINPLAASAAYWIASQASEIVTVKSGDVGSIGVFMAHTDCSAFNEMQGFKVTYIFAGPHKVEGNMDEPLDPEARKYFQSEVDTIYSDFLKAVARGRDTTVEDVMENFGGGRTLMAPAAKKKGMVDEIATIDGAFARWGVITTAGARRRGEDEQPEPVAEIPSAPDEVVVDTPPSAAEESDPNAPFTPQMDENSGMREAEAVAELVSDMLESAAETEEPEPVVAEPAAPKKVSRRRRLAILAA